MGHKAGTAHIRPAGERGGRHEDLFLRLVGEMTEEMERLKRERYGAYALGTSDCGAGSAAALMRDARVLLRSGPPSTRTIWTDDGERRRDIR